MIARSGHVVLLVICLLGGSDESEEEKFYEMISYYHSLFCCFPAAPLVEFWKLLCVVKTIA